MATAQPQRAKTIATSTSYDEYKNLASIHENEVPLPSPPMSPESDKSNFAFTRAALAFRDRLDGIRSKRESTQPLIAPESDPNKDDGSDQHGAAQRVRILRGVQGLLTALLSLAIAVMQGRVYVIYLDTKDVPGAWPSTPNLLPTLLLFSVAIAALVFDIALIVGYTTRGTVGRVAYQIAIGAHYIAVTTKMASFALTSIVCRVGFNFGNSTGTSPTQDLWSWSCTDQAAQMSSVNQAPTDCSTQTAAWAFALANIGIEALGVLINLYVKISGAADIVADGGDGGEKGGDGSDTSSPKPKMTPKQRRSQLGSMYSDVSSHLADVSPQIDDKPAEQLIETKVEGFGQGLGL